jgi:hypothetical protein
LTLAFAVLCHQSPRHVFELIRHIQHPRHCYLLHGDAKAPPALHDALAQLAQAAANVHVVPAALCSWGGWSLVDATLRALAAALALPVPWRHFVLLSEHHLPLQPPEQIAASLPDGVSFCAATGLTAMDRAMRADVLHRFARRYRELPGVGMFAAGGAGCAPLETLHLGSQWLVLARPACERLAAHPPGAAVWRPFRESLVPDETAVQSVLRGPVGRGLTVRNANLTFTAWPHLGGGPDSAFTDANVRAARARGHAFIRKRPRRLPPFAAAMLAALRPAPPVLPLPPEPAAPRSAAADALAAALAAMLRGRFPALRTERMDVDGAPACCVRFRLPGLPEALAVSLLSQDLREFKLLLSWRPNLPLRLAPLRIGGYRATVLGARLPGLLLAHEIHLPEVPDSGFVVAASEADLAPPLAAALATAQRLAPLAV